MPGKIETVAWDSSIFLAWLHNESRPSGQMEGIEQDLARIEAAQENLIASSLIHGEIRDPRLNDQARQLFAGFLKRSNVVIVPADDPINKLASGLSDYYEKQKQVDNSPPLGLPDAIHLATAIIYKVKAFYTFDEKGNSRFRGLIPLSGNVAGHNLTICKPPYAPPAPKQLKLIDS